MSSLSKIEKNMKKFNEKNIENILLDRYSKMSPIEIRDTIKKSVRNKEIEMNEKFNIKLKSIEKEVKNKIEYNNKEILSTMSVEFLYELARQMGYMDLDDSNEDDKYVKESTKYRLQEIWCNAMDNINEYMNINDPIKSSKIYEERKEYIGKEFNIFNL